MDDGPLVNWDMDVAPFVGAWIEIFSGRQQ